MRFVIERERLLKLLQLITGVVERRQTMPILSNVLLVAKGQRLTLTCTDLEVELSSFFELASGQDIDASLTVPARKLLDICKVLPDGATIDFYQDDDNRIVVRSERSRFVLPILPAADFPRVDWLPGQLITEFTIPYSSLKYLIESTHFAMAQQDVRYYLNGLLLEIKDSMVWGVATDGHRLALNGVRSAVANSSVMQVIVPYKGVVELLRLLDDSDKEAQVTINENHIRVVSGDFVFTSKLIDGKYPDYNRAIPRGGDKKIIIDRRAFKQALTRVAVLSSEMFRGVQLQIKPGLMRLFAQTQEQEAEEEMVVDYQGDDIAAGFNVTYLLDALSHMDSDKLVMALKDGASSALLEEFEGDGNAIYVVMPLRL